MSLVLINTFLAIVEAGSLVKASRQLNVTQSTITSRLRLLEDEVGQTLLHRKKSGMVLTASGIKFRQYADAMSHLWQQALLETSLPVGMESMCNLGCENDLWPVLGRPLAKVIRQSYPTTALTIRQADQQQIDELLGTGIIDAAISYRASKHEDTSVQPLGAEKLVLYTTVAGSPERYDPNYIYVDAGADFGRSHAEAYSDAGVAKNSIDSTVWGLEHLLDVGGSAYLPEKLARAAVDQSRLFTIEGAPVFYRNVYLITNNRALKAWLWLPEVVMELSTKGL